MILRKKSKRIRALAVLAGVLSGAIAMATDVHLRIVTCNVKEGIADTANARDACGNMLTTNDLDGAGPNSGLNPDILCLEETRSLSNLQSFRDDFLPGYHVTRGTFVDAGNNCQACIYRSDLTLLDTAELVTNGPRRLLRVVLDVPGTDEHLVVYTHHFKAGVEASDIATRAAEANRSANHVSANFANGINLDATGAQYFPSAYVFVGDLNHDDFAGATINPMLDGGDNGLPTHLNDVRSETLAGASVSPFIGDTWSTQGSLDRRYDYILVSDLIFDPLDTNNNGTVSQAERNAAGFVYISGDDLGRRANGDVDATTQGTDHAPVILDITLPCRKGDLNVDGIIDLPDLSGFLAVFGLSDGDPGFEPCADLDDSGTIDLGDLSGFLGKFGTTG
ncbi:MAG: hypothetical protein KDA32_01785 [Phycisphaerales bacterium]|nr:hypothetical protein [Phycisphaerales bacterium]